MGRKNKIEKSSSKLFKRKLNEKKNSSTIDFNKRKIFRKGGNTAKTYFDNLLSFGNHLQLFSEDIDFKSKRLLGNFPQAYSHLALIDTALSFNLAC